MAKTWVVCIALCCCLCCGTASANWQYTEWGMTLAQVAEAASGRAVAMSSEESVANSVADSNEKALLKATYESGQYKFTAVFSFDSRSGGLSSVKLNLVNLDKALELKGSLGAKYGKPAEQGETAVISFARWRDNMDEIEYFCIGNQMLGVSSVSVGYKPRITTDNDGL